MGIDILAQTRELLQNRSKGSGRVYDTCLIRVRHHMDS